MEALSVQERILVALRDGPGTSAELAAELELSKKHVAGEMRALVRAKAVVVIEQARFPSHRTVSNVFWLADSMRAAA